MLVTINIKNEDIIRDPKVNCDNCPIQQKIRALVKEDCSVHHKGELIFPGYAQIWLGSEATQWIASYDNWRRGHHLYSYPGELSFQVDIPRHLLKD